MSVHAMENGNGEIHTSCSVHVVYLMTYVQQNAKTNSIEKMDIGLIDVRNFHVMQEQSLNHGSKTHTLHANFKTSLISALHNRNNLPFIN